MHKNAKLKLDYGNLKSALQTAQPSLADVRNAIIEIRNQKLPKVEEFGSAGSFFKNPVVSREQYEKIASEYANVPHYEVAGGVKIPAAWMIEQCGLKGKQLNGAKVYEKQPLVIVNANNAKAEDIVGLAAEVMAEVKSRFDVSISPEVNYI